MARRHAVLGIGVCVFALPLRALADEQLFREHVAPVLEKHCLSCHAGNQPKGGLSLETADGFRRGGESGPIVEPGRPDASSLLDQVSGSKPAMPQQAPPLAAQDVAAIRRWVEQGAHWPTGVKLTDRKFAGAWWSLEPLMNARPPTVDSSWTQGSIDAFVFKRLADESLHPNPQADKRTLIRRLTIDLTGLPPSIGEVESFIRDQDPLAYEKLVDRLLASPAYGERFARPWLDVAHYGETHGYDKDKRRPNAWPYRDYVIAALNRDLPYGRFIREQVAGDVLFPEDAGARAATGFLAAGPWDFVGHVELAEGTVNKLATRVIDRDDFVATVMGTFCSLTVHCARCHDHPFDPIKQREYYGLQAVFAGIERDEVPWEGATLRATRAALKSRLEKLTPKKGEKLDPAMAAARSEVEKELASLPPVHGVYAIRSIAPRSIELLSRGEVTKPLGVVGPAALACVKILPVSFSAEVMSDEGKRRVALADWIADERNPLTWRSVANRVWQAHFGRGIVETPNDFGRLGALPTHPELLDFLAARLLHEGGSLKRLHREIVTSAAYRQASTHDPVRAAKDGQNRFHWRMNRRRLEAEMLRDAVLAVSGQLDRRMGGPSFDAFGFIDDHSPRYLYDKHDVNDTRANRRAIYRFVVRSVPDPFMEALDAADASQATPMRDETVTAPQALALLNNPFMIRQAEWLAERAKIRAQETGSTASAEAFRRTLARDPTNDEAAAIEDHARRHGLASLCRLLFNMNEFLFVD